MKVVVQHYIGTTEEWRTANPKLYEAVWGFEKTTDGKVLAKLGNGVDLWNNLKYFDKENIHNLPEEIQEIKEIAEQAVRIAGNDSLSYPVNLDTENPTPQQLQAIYEEVSGKTGEPYDLTILEDLTFYKAYKYYLSTHEWIDTGAIGISVFTDQSIGGIKGSDESGHVQATPAGTGKVSGWDEFVLMVESLVSTVAGLVQGLLKRVRIKENNELMTLEEAQKSVYISPYGSTMPPGILVKGFINDEWLPYFRLLKLEGQIIDISEDSPYYMLGQIIYVGDENNNNLDLEGCYKVDSNGQRNTLGTRMVLPDGCGMFLRGAGVNSRHTAANNTPYDGRGRRELSWPNLNKSCPPH